MTGILLKLIFHAGSDPAPVDQATWLDTPETKDARRDHRLQPPPMSGLRLAEPTQMHVTLHFIGDADLDQMAAALHNLPAKAFQLEFHGVGQFPSRAGAVTLFAGVRKSAELVALHAAVADAPAGHGFQPESRPYAPHVTLARCDQGMPASVVDEFLANHATISVPAVSVVRFGLYSSEFVDQIPVYKCEKSFSLLAAETIWTVHRQDDNGNRFVVQAGLSREEADQLVAVFEARGHKQLYWAEQAAK